MKRTSFSLHRFRQSSFRIIKYIFLSESSKEIPNFDDYDVTWFRTGHGRPDSYTEISPLFINMTAKLYNYSLGKNCLFMSFVDRFLSTCYIINHIYFTADLKINFGRPIWIDIDLLMMKKLKDFTSELFSQNASVDGEPSSNSTKDTACVVRSLAVSTDYISITVTAGHDFMIDPSVKVSCISMNLGICLKVEERAGILVVLPGNFLCKVTFILYILPSFLIWCFLFSLDFRQRMTGNLRLCALALSTYNNKDIQSFLLPCDASFDLEIFSTSPSISPICCWYA